jgi:acyl carrier protein
MLTQQEIYEKVSATLAAALGVGEDAIQPTATLRGDLRADSIGLLDLVFQLEREFGITIPDGELFPESIFRGDPELVHEGKVTDQGLRELRRRLPFADLGAFEEDRLVSRIGDLFTVGLIVCYLQGKATAGQAQPSSR